MEKNTEKNKRPFKIFKTKEDQENAEREYSASLTPLERLFVLRKMINNAYGMHGFEPNKIPKTRSLRIISF
jgi:hypothetical protein